jgi:hypothetical protein
VVEGDEGSVLFLKMEKQVRHRASKADHALTYLLRLSRKEEEGAISVLAGRGGEPGDRDGEPAGWGDEAGARLAGRGEERGPKSMVELRTKSAW